MLTDAFISYFFSKQTTNINPGLTVNLCGRGKACVFFPFWNKCKCFSIIWLTFKQWILATFKPSRKDFIWKFPLSKEKKRASNLERLWCSSSHRCLNSSFSYFSVYDLFCLFLNTNKTGFASPFNYNLNGKSFKYSIRFFYYWSLLQHNRREQKMSIFLFCFGLLFPYLT